MLRRITMLAVLACVCAATATASGTTSTNALYVFAFTTAPGQVSETQIGLRIPESSAPAQKLVVYVPPAYSANLSQYKDAQVGGVEVDLGQGHAALLGDLRVGDPALATTPEALACAPGPHTAVWLLEAESSEHVTLQIPVFVDALSQSFASYAISACLPAPEVAGSTLPARITDFILDLPGVMSNPTHKARYIWRAVVTPYVVGTADANGAASAEVQSLLGVPQTLTMHVATKKRTATLSGKLTDALGPRAGVRVHVWYSATKDFKQHRELGVATTRRDGSYTLTHVMPGSGYLDAWVNFYMVGCQADPLGTAPCVQSTIAPPMDAVARVSVK